MFKKYAHAITCILFAGLITVGMATPSNAKSAQIFRTGWEPFEGIAFNACEGEDYALTGKHFTEVQVTENAAGGLHLVIQDRLRGIAEGLTTGSKYISMEGVTVVENDTAGGAIDVTMPFRGTLIALDKDVSDSHFSALLHVTIDANGALRSFIDTFELVCH